MASSSPSAREALDPSIVGFADDRKASTRRVDIAKHNKGTDRLIDHGQLAMESDLPRALARHGLGDDWESLMGEVERRGWYVIPTAALSTSIDETPTFRRVYVGMISNESHVTVSGDGSTIIEALGWAMVHALDASQAEAS
jgi:hypothetical protein